MGHEVQDRISAELARRVAERLRHSPELVDFARANLARWRSLNADAPSLIRCYDEWEEILKRPSEDVCNVLCGNSDEHQRLRQNSPFAGVLSASEVWEIKSRLRHATTPA